MKLFDSLGQVSRLLAHDSGHGGLGVDGPVDYLQDLSGLLHTMDLSRCSSVVVVHHRIPLFTVASFLWSVHVENAHIRVSCWVTYDDLLCHAWDRLSPKLFTSMCFLPSQDVLLLLIEDGLLAFGQSIKAEALELLQAFLEITWIVGFELVARW